MKKKFILFLLLTLFPLNTYALDFTVNNQTITVNDLQTFNDYCYFTYVKGSSDFTNLVSIEWPSYGYMCAGMKEYVWKYNNFFQTGSDISTYSPYALVRNWLKTDNTLETSSANTNGFPIPTDTFNYYSSVNICNRWKCDTGNYLESNFTFDSIECRYNTTDCSTYEEPGVDEPDTPTSNDYSDYLKAGLVLISTFIMFYFINKTFQIRKEKNR